MLRWCTARISEASSGAPHHVAFAEVIEERVAVHQCFREALARIGDVDLSKCGSVEFGFSGEAHGIRGPLYKDGG